MVDDDLWWLWCGDEGSGHLIGPHFSPESAECDRRVSLCPHDHGVLTMTLRQMAARLPVNARLWDRGIYDPRPTPTRLLIHRPTMPWSAWDRWAACAAMLITLKETTCV